MLKNYFRKIALGVLLAGITLLAFYALTGSPAASAGADKRFVTHTVTLSSGDTLDENIISGPPAPPPGYGPLRKAVVLPETNAASGTASLTVPAYDWTLGCSATSGSMIAAYYDRNGFPNMYTGPTNGGLAPLDSSPWPNWKDGAGSTYAQVPLAASHNGLDGRATKGTIDDYWVAYGSSASDPYITGAWTQHTFGDAIGDYMKTSQSAFSNSDGSTTFWNYTSATKLTCATMASSSLADGTLGRELFYQARGYIVTDCYNQKTDNIIAGGFSFTQYKAEIDAGRPVMLNLAGHTIVGVGYDSSTNTVYLHDTWDYLTHTMTWGGSYSGMALQSVSIVNLQTTSPTISGNAGIGGATLSYTDGTAKTATANSGGSYSFTVSYNWSGTVTPSKPGYTFTAPTKTYANVTTDQATQNYTAAPADVTPPTVLSSVRASTNPSTAATVNFTVTFSEAVTGVDATDFAITQSGLTGTSVTNLSGSGASYTVTASTGSGNNGTLRLDLVDDDSVKDLAGNPLGGTGTGNGSFTGGETYTILKNVLGAGTYDDPNAAITYTGSWSPNSSSGPYLGTIHTTSSIGDSAAVNFSGQQIKVIYTGAPTAGILDVYVDSTKVASINQYGANWDQQKAWTSDLFAAGTHTLRLVYASGGSFADLDGLQVITTPALLASGVNDDTAANLNYEGRWYTLTGVTGPASGSLHYSSAPGDDLQGSFTGQQFRLTYLASPFSGLADLYIDGVKIATLNQYSDNWDWQTTWTSGLLSAGTHSFRMVYANGGSLVSLDALEVVSSPAILGTNSYDDGNAGLNYQGRWYTFSAMTGPSLGTLHYMNYQDGTAMLLFSGRQFRLTYLAAPNAGVMDVYVDNVKVTSLNQYSDTWDWQRVWSSDLYASGTHSLRLVNANGVMTNVDGVEILGSPSILGTNVYDDLAAGLNYDGNWQKVSAVSGAYNSTFQYSNGVGENLEVPFNGRQIKLTYLTSPTFGTADVYIDGVKVTTLDQSSADWTFGVTWTSAVLSAGDHSLRLVHAGGAVVTIDAAEVIP